MALDLTLNIWTFDGIAFERADFDYGAPLWPDNVPIISKEPLMGGGAYRDFGGTQPGEITVRARFASVADRDAMRQKRDQGVVGALTKKSGESGYYIITNMVPIWIAAGVPGAEITFS